MKKRLAVAAVGVALVATTLTGCSKQYIDASMMGLRYAGGVGEGGKFKECLKTGKADYSDDTLYLYPTTQRQDDFNSDRYKPSDPNAADNKDITVTTKDGVPVHIRGNQNFGLNTECDTIRAFHETIGKTRKAYFNDDGTYNKGWITTMNYYITPATVEQWRDVISTHNVSELWPSTALYTALVDEVNENMPAAVDKRTEGDEKYYNRLTFSLTSITPAEAYQTQYLERQTAQTAAETADLNKAAKIKQAEADKAVRVAQAEAEAAEKREQIKAYQLPGMTEQQAVRAYNEAQLIAKGGNPYQPGGTPLIQTGGE
jgi:regulator of protease activity HflC (stomatin/prohibitin superfamily)